MNRAKNATDLFRQQEEKYWRNRESFWSSLFAIQILAAKSQLKIPVHEYKQEDKENWWFEEKESLVLPAGLTFFDVIVEGNIRMDRLVGEHNKDFENLRPDILIIEKEDKAIHIIETKTVGASISSKERLYIELRDWLREKKLKAEAYLLLSAGHEKNNEIQKLSKEEWKVPKKIILWESFFEAIEEQVEKSLISGLIPGLSDYYSDKSYLKGIFSNKVFNADSASDGIG